MGFQSYYSPIPSFGGAFMAQTEKANTKECAYMMLELFYDLVFSQMKVRKWLLTLARAGFFLEVWNNE